MIDSELSSFGDFRLGDWVVQPRLNRITGGGSTVTIELKMMQVLVCLARHAGDLVPRQELIDTVWATEFISEGVLTRIIAELRKALGDDARNSSYIETIHGRGYRLLMKPSSVSDEESSITRTVSHFLLLNQIGAGGMGVVYRAHDRRLDRDVAIKMLPEHSARDEDWRARFEREAKLLASLNHPNIATLHGVEEHGGQLFLVMELLEGESLRELISRSGVASGKAVEYARAIADGLAAAHDKNIVHRDLKPENVFLTADGRIKILDFGLAKLKLPETDLATETPTETLGTVPGALLGTVAYMAPEQLHGKAADHRSDIFALGVVLYEMLTGGRPFGGGTTAEVAAEIIKADPAPISDSLPPTVANVVKKCLEKRPEDRFSSAHDLSLILGSIHSKSTARPARERSFLQRRWPYLAAVVLASIVALVLVLPPVGLFKRLARQPAQAAVPRVVVLPFENLGPPEDEYFTDGITEEITSRLAAVSGLQVISRSSAMYYEGRHVPVKQIGEELDVGYVLEGTIRWDRSEAGHGRVRITPQLIRVADDSHLWSERYDRVLEDIFAVQSDIAQEVIHQLQATLLDSERRTVEAHPTDNMEAYQAYLLGNQYNWTGLQKRDVLLAVQMFERAIALDPEFAVAHAALSEAHSNLYHFRYDFTPERLSKARESAERALQLRPGLPEGHRALGWYYYSGFRDYDRALEEFSIAAAALPNDPNVLAGIYVVLHRSGRWDETLQALQRWNSVDPQGYLAADETAGTYTWLRKHEKAEIEARRAIAIAPDRPDAYWTGATNYVVWDGSTDRARHLLEAAPEPDSPDIAYVFFQFDLYDRRPDVAMARLENSFNDVYSTNEIYAPRELLTCMCLSELGRADESEQVCSLAADLLQHEIDVRPWDYRLHVALGHALARLGRNNEAVRSCERAAELIPIAVDAVNGPQIHIEIAKIYTRVGEADTALDKLDELMSIPCPLSVGLLRLDPAWDPLRDNPRFQALLEKYDTN